MPQEVFNRDGLKVCHIEQRQCYYGDSALRSIVASGYKVKEDGKIWRPSKKKEENPRGNG